MSSLLTNSDSDASMVDSTVCCAGKHCGMRGVNLKNVHHTCINCEKAVHGALCGTLWEELPSDCGLSVEDLGPAGQKNASHVGRLICKLCIEQCTLRKQDC